jgi:curved DNA-binding protein CbpA
MVDYYASLHVLPSADADVIKAAFRVLARRYHPDSCAIPKEDAHRRMQEINAAYEVLGDEQKRAAYDRDLAGAKAEPEFDATGHERDVVFEQDWQVACKYCAKAEVDFEFLTRFSTKLAFSYASYLIETKKFDSCREIAHNFHKDFVRNYFGNNISIQVFASQLLLVGEKDAAKAVNQAVRILGNGLSEEMLSQNIFSEYPKSKIKLIFFRAIYLDDFYVTEEFLKLMGVICKSSLWWNGSLKVEFEGTKHTLFYPGYAKWVKQNFGHKEDFRCVWQGPRVWSHEFPLVG